MRSCRRIPSSLVKYGVQGAGATVANVALMSGLVEVADLPPEAAAVVSTCALLLGGYWVVDRWVFQDSSTPDSHLKRGIQYYAVILAGKTVNYGVFVALVAAGVWYPAAWIIGSAVAFVGTYGGNRYLWEGTTA